MRIVTFAALLLAWLMPAAAAEPRVLPCARLRSTAGEVVAGPAGELLRIDLTRPGAGPIAALSLPAELPAGKYELALRVRLEPVDSYGDRFMLGVGQQATAFATIASLDPRDLGWRNWRTTAQLGGGDQQLSLMLGRSSFAEPHATAILLDTLTVTPRGRDGLYLSAARCDKVLYDPGEEAVCTVRLHNGGGAPASARLRAEEVTDLDSQRVLAEQTSPVPAGADATATLRWPSGAEQYGRRLRVALLDDQGRATDWVDDYYAVADNVWKVAIRAPGGPHMTHPDSVHCPYKTDAQWADFLTSYPDQIHGSYGNFVEWFAWAPDDAFNMTPREPSWISGQGCYQHLRSRVLDLTRTQRANGVWPITYAKSAASGPPSYEFMRRHPEFGLGRYQVQYDQQRVRDWGTQVPGQEKTIFYTWMSLVLDITNPKIVDTAVGEILDSAAMFGWRGARYDDHYSLWGKPADPLSTRNMSRIFELGEQRDKRFSWGFNYITRGTACVWPGQPLPDRPWSQATEAGEFVPDWTPPRFANAVEPWPELKVACEHGSLIMNEEARGAQGGGYTNYGRLLTHEAGVVRALGGHYGPIPFDAGPQSAFDAVYPDLLRLACRAHTYGDMRLDQRLRQFVTRYSALLYGDDLKPITDPESLLGVRASPAVWWHNFAYRCDTGGHRRVVVHLLQPPRRDAIGGNRDGSVTRISSPLVTYKGPERVARAWALSPFTDGFQQALTPAGKLVAPGDFYLWQTVVLELQ